MNKFKKVGLAIAVATGMAFAGDPLWYAGIEHGQVTFPWIFDCKYGPSSTFEESDPDDPCFKTMGGWWFGVTSGPSVEDVAEPNPYLCGPLDFMKTSAKSGANKVEVEFKNGWKSLVGPDYSTCEGPDVTDRETGESQLPDDYLNVKFTIADGDYENYKPNQAVLAVGLTTAPDPHAPVNTPVDMTRYTEGFCLTYTSDHNDESTANGSNGSDVAFELGWDTVEGERNYDKDSPLWDSWLYYLPTATTPKTLDFKWTGAKVSSARYVPNKSGDFTQDNWADPAGLLGIDEATKKMVAVRIRLKGYEAAVVNFKLYKLGFPGDCGDAEVLPIIPSKNIPSVNFTLNGRMLSTPVNKPALVQIYNLQGAMVQSKTVSPGNASMNLSALPSGIYMVRAPSLGHTSRIVVK